MDREEYYSAIDDWCRGCAYATYDDGQAYPGTCPQICEHIILLDELFKGQGVRSCVTP